MNMHVSKIAASKKQWFIIFMALMFALVAIVGVSMGTTVAKVQRLLNTETFYPNISVDGITLTGMTKQEALDIIKQARQADLDAIRLELRFDDKVWSFGYSDIAASYDVEQQIDKAYEVGRQGDVISRLKEIYQTQQNGVSFNTTFTYDISLLRDDVEAIAKELEIPAVDASVKFTPNTNDKNRFLITKEKIGRVIDVDKAMKDIEETVAQGNYDTPIYLEAHEVKPKVFASDLEKATYLIAEFSTPLGNSTEDRITNIELASGAFNGTVVWPGEVFSINEATGERTREKGYKDAAVFKEGGKVIEDDLAGGVCQVSSTLYNAVLMSDLEVVERYHHSRKTSYVDLGRDATITYGVLDFKFRNNRTTPVFLERTIANGQLTVRIYGQPLPEGRKIAITSEIYEVVPAPEPEMIVDQTLKPGQKVEDVKGTDGYKVRTYKIVYDKNGNKISSSVISNDYYKPIRSVIRYNPTKTSSQVVPRVSPENENND